MPPKRPDVEDLLILSEEFLAFWEASPQELANTATTDVVPVGEEPWGRRRRPLPSILLRRLCRGQDGQVSPRACFFGP